jgi:hypothetical protein
MPSLYVRSPGSLTRGPGYDWIGTTLGRPRLICREFLAGDAALSLIRDSVESLSVDSPAGTQKNGP